VGSEVVKSANSNIYMLKPRESSACSAAPGSLSSDSPRSPLYGGGQRRILGAVCYLPLTLTLTALMPTAQGEMWPLSQFSRAADEASPGFPAEAKNPKKGWHVYGGGALGVSRLNPEFETTAFSGTENRDSGYKEIDGIRLNDNFQFETNFNRLGAAQVMFNSSQAEAIDYDVFSFDMLYRIPEIVDVPFHTFAIMGFTALDSDSNAKVEEEAAFKLKAGVALEYPLRDEWAIRGTAERFSGDTPFFSAGVLRYLGEDDGNNDQLSLASVLPGLPGSSADLDGDSVPDSSDRCPNTLAGLKVDKYGCGIFNRAFDDIVFKPNSTTLTSQARGVLDGLAQELAKVSHLTVEVQAHTDNTGSASYNTWLSTKRAEAIIRYLVQRGIPKERLRPKGYGEKKPLETNDTPHGRAKNRRAEFRILN